MNIVITLSHVKVLIRLLFLFKGAQDYSSIDVILNFTDGETIKNVSIPIIADMYVEPTEYFTVSIEALDGDVVFPITDTVIKIIDDDGMNYYYILLYQ